ncbi:MAG: histidine phosphatase family protein [Betaproteobacteria bacterium]|nr:histidine phosphatase family protein [Betaproteobacteria bacterium]
MSVALPLVYLARHGATAWSVAGQHTGRTDVPLTAAGEADARRLAARLAGGAFAQVLVSPSQRARRTCELAGYGARAAVDPDLAEWDYGAYEGMTTAEILARRPGWVLFRDGCPEGEAPADVAARADRLIARVRAVAGNVLLFSSAHILRTIAARWLGLDAGGGRHFLLGTASVSVLGYEHDATQPVIRSWNDAAPPLAMHAGTA